jgi:hypothetical protein
MPKTNYRQKSEEILGEAWEAILELRDTAEELHSAGEISDKGLLLLKQDDIKIQLVAAQTYAMLAASAPVEVNNFHASDPISDSAPDPEPPVPEEDREGEETRDSFAEFLGGDPLDMLERVIEVGRIFTKPRPVKDSPQA